MNNKKIVYVEDRSNYKFNSLLFLLTVFLFTDFFVSRISFAEPVDVAVKQIASGADYSCAITALGKLYCWGNNNHGQLGDGTESVSKTTPVAIMDNVKSVSLGKHHSCAVTIDNMLYCWGFGIYGALGNGSEEDEITPIKILDNVKHVATGEYHTCSVTIDNVLFCWGANDLAQLGDGSFNGKTIPTKIMDNVEKIVLGYDHSCAITMDNKLYCWGHNVSGKVGNGVEDGYVLVPTKILDDVKDVSLGDVHSCAVTISGEVFCWGDGSGGKIGNGYTGASVVPTKIMGDVKDTELGNGHTCAVKNNSKLYCWGINGNGQLGDGTTTSKFTPTEIIDDVRNAGLGESHTCVTTLDCKVYCWGMNSAGQIGNGSESLTEPVLVPYEVFSGGGTVDTDSDGTIDCYDECPVDPKKVEEGICGCGVEDIDSDGDGVLDCLDGCPNDPKNKELNPPEVGCFVNNSEVPEKFDPKVEQKPERIVTPKIEKLLPVYAIKKENKATVYFERFSRASLKQLEELTQISAKNTTYKYEIRINKRNKKTGNRVTNTIRQKSARNSKQLKLTKKLIYNIKYRIVINQGKKEKTTKWSKAVKVKK